MKALSKVILIEDDKKKIEDIQDFLISDFEFNSLIVKESYQSGLRELIANNYELLLLDMSIPTWDKSPNESGGNYEKFGGYKILKELQRKEKSIKTILITMFDDFGESDTSITLKQLDSILQEEFPETYLGVVFYNSTENIWKNELMELISKSFK